jgi:peptidyl-prolyl cis-trans isomerase C/foldase protein PrsA
MAMAFRPASLTRLHRLLLLYCHPDQALHGSHPQEFDDICFKLRIGELSPVVASPYGFHIFKLIDRKAKETLPLSDVSAKIEPRLIRKKTKERFDAWFGALRREADIEINTGVLERVSLKD